MVNQPQDPTGQNGCHFTDDTFKSIFLNENVRISIKIPRKFIAKVQLTISQHWFRYWLGADQATSHYLSQWWLDYRRIYAPLGLNELSVIVQTRCTHETTCVPDLFWIVCGNAIHQEQNMASGTSHMMTSSNGSIFRVTGHLCGEFTGPRWIPHTKASDAELWCLLWSVSE